MDAVIVYSVSTFITNERANEIESFFQANPLPNSSRRISQTLEQIRSNAKLLASISGAKLVQDPKAVWN